MLQTADLVWIPSLANVGRQTALEAFAQGRAVIASAVPCLSEIIRDGDTGCLVPPGDVVQLARCTRRLFDDPALRQRLGHAARQSASQRFSLVDAVARWRDMYRQVA